MRKNLSAGLALILATGPGHAAIAAEDALHARAKEVGALIRKDPGGYDAIFAPEFLKAVPPAQLDAIFTKFHADAGAVTRIDRLPGGTATQGAFTLSCAAGVTVRADLAIADAAPHRVTSLFLGPPRPAAASLDAIAAAVAALPGRTTFAATRLEAGGPRLLAGHAPDAPLAIGSAFKLWILGALAADVKAGKRRWADVVTLRAEDRSHPSGRLHTWPVGTPVTLHTLAAAMISESDNTATDALLHGLGRARVEAMVATMGTKEPARNRPFLSTLEMFKIKAGADAGAPAAWARMDEAARRKYLAGPVAAMPYDAVKEWAEPRALDTLEWFASAADLARMLDWLRRDETARGILAINRGGRFDEAAWPYVGFKGGSEPGVVALAFVLRDRQGGWWSLAASWNDPEAEVEPIKLLGLVERAAELLLASP